MSKKSKTREFMESIGVALIAALIIRALVIQSYRIPTGSMKDTLLIGDFLLVNKFIYGINTPNKLFTKHIPLPAKRLPGFKDPKRGEIVVFRFPGDPMVDYIKRSGGIFRDMTIHDFDMARFLLGEEIAEVVATAAVLVDPAIGIAGDFDSVQVMLKTASGRQAMISNSRRATYGYDQRIEVHGSKGAVSAENQRPVSIEVATVAGYTRPPLHDFFMTRYTEAYAAEIATFIAALRGTGKAEPTGEDGLIALALAEAALKSVAEARVVKMSEIL
mgnify:CR=1 FL=1